MRKQYDIHRAARPLDRGIHEKYKGAVDFCGGAYGILKGAVQREREMRECGKASSAGAGVNERTSAELLRDLELLTRQLAAQGVVVDMTDRTSTPVEPEQAPNAPTGGALQSQVLQNYMV